MLTITTGPTGGLKAKGEIDMATAPELEQALKEAIRTGGPVEVDFEEVTFMDSSGLHALITVSTSMNGTRPLVVSNVPPSVMRLIEIVGIDQLPSLEVRR